MEHSVNTAAFSMRNNEPPEGGGSDWTTKTGNNNSHHYHRPLMMTSRNRHHHQHHQTATVIKHLRDEFGPRAVGGGGGGGRGVGTSSRDDDSTVHSAQYSSRSGNGSINGAVKMTTTNVIGRLGTSEIDSKLAALNAKSRLLRGMTQHPPNSPLSYQRDASTVRLDFLTRQSHAFRTIPAGGALSSPIATPSQAPTTASSHPPENNKKVTFETDRSDGPWHATDDDRSVRSRKSIGDQSNDIPTSSPFNTTGVVASHPWTVSTSESVHSPPQAGGVSGALIAHAAPWDVASRSGRRDPARNNRTLAMNVLCEMILAGYTMTRDHCSKCTMALLKKPKATFATSINGVNTNPREECVYCPIDKLRGTVTGAISKRIAATGVPHGAGLGNGVDGIGALSDAVCIEIAREQGRGGSLMDERCCEVCQGPELLLGDGSTKCVMCDVLKIKLRSTANGNDVHRTSPDPSMTGTNRLPHSSSSSTMIQKIPSFTSSTYELTNSPSIKSNERETDNPEVDTAKLRIQIQDECSKITDLRKSLESPSIGQMDPTGANQELAELISTVGDQINEHTGPSAFQDPLKQGIEKSGGTGLPINLVKLQDQLNKVVNRLGKCEAKPDISPVSLANLQCQLKAELARAKESQAALELTLQNSHVDEIQDKSLDEIITELDKAKQDQLTLESIIEGTMFIEKATSDDPGLANSVTEELLLASQNRSYSISQQEVDATGNVKEYIPPPSYFQSKIPSEIIVYHLPEMPECDPSVTAQSHHTHNLKRSERNPPQKNSIDCCGNSFSVLGKTTQIEQHQDDDFYDCETIETDDCSADYTLNTVDDSRIMRYHINIDDDLIGEKMGAEVNRSTPKATKSKFFFCFDCGADDDAYSMVERSERGIIMNRQVEPQEHYFPNRNNVIVQEEQFLQGRGLDPTQSAVDEYRHHDRVEYRSPSGSIDDSDFGSMHRAGRDIIAKRTCFVNSAGREVIAKQTHFTPMKDDEGNTRPPSILHVGGRSAQQHVRSPSPLSDWDSVNNGSDLGTENFGHASPNRPQPKSILRLPLPRPPPRHSDHHSVQSDLSDLSSINRKVKFGSLYIGGRGGRTEQHQLRALTEESGCS